MALLQRCLPQCSSPAILSSSCIVKGYSIQSVAQCRPFLICRADAKINGRNLRVSRDEESPARTPTVFKDESNGIVCYTNEDGEITCEGYDEGPHFQPEPQTGYTMRKRRTIPLVVQGRGKANEGVSFKTTGGKMEESIREGKAETSFNSSEL